jgi:dipeptidyl aminopeptidase/acylaminoacyl peptidase
MFAYLTEVLGVAVVVPNIRGSTGYGEEYQDADNGPYREAAFEDIDLVLDWLAAQKLFDSRRMAVAGDSYGGYLTLMTLARHPGMFAAGIDFAGLTDLVKEQTFNSAFLRDSLRREYGDATDPEVGQNLLRISPISYIDAPLLVIHGEHDRRVDFRPVVEFVQALRASGKSIVFARMTREGHGVNNRATRNALTALMIEFLRRHLEPITQTETSSG